jgi:hypothetical protein
MISDALSAMQDVTAPLSSSASILLTSRCRVDRSRFSTKYLVERASNHC